MSTFTSARAAAVDRAVAKTVFLLGPCSPPDGGTTIPFSRLVHFVSGLPGVQLRVMDTHVRGDVILTRTAAGYLRAIWEFLRLTIGAIVVTLQSDVAIINGSPRFVVTVCAAVVAIVSIVGRRDITVYVAGGNFDIYYMSLPRAYRRIVRWCLRLSHKLLLQTQCSRMGLGSEFSNLAVVPNWYSAVPAVPRTSQTSSDRVRFVFVGDVRPEKGVVEVLAGFGRTRSVLAGHGIAASLDIFGRLRPEFEGTFEVLLSRAGDGVHYHGLVEHSALMEQLAGFDILLLPTYHTGEGYPGVILEAMSRGLVIIASNIRSISELITDGENGLLCVPKDADELAACMCRLSLEPMLRQELAQEAARSARVFSEDQVLPRLCELAGLAVDRDEGGSAALIQRTKAVMR
jgi:glycosyltransferase involved in cell wall biosynthesis